MTGVVLRSAYGRIRFSDEAALVITDTQGIDSMEEIEIITDGDIKNMYRVSRRPNGIDPNTNIDNLGLKVSLRS